MTESILAHGAKFTKPTEKSQHQRRNLIQQVPSGYTRSNHSDLQRRFCREWRLMWIGGGETRLLELLVIPLSLRNVEDLLHESGVDVSYESVRYWWHRFGYQSAC